jgi:AAA15 family ATPase/GTPase
MEIGSSAYNALCSAVIYGSNASGKSNIIVAMDTCKSIAIRGHIRSVEGISINAAAFTLELVPSRLYETHKPNDFRIKFIKGGYLKEYGFSADIGCM